MSINIRSQNPKTTSETTYDTNPIANSINSIQLRYFNQNINSRRYANSSNKNNVYLRKEENEEINALNKMYLTKEREYNNLMNQYNEIIKHLNQKNKDLDECKKKYKSLIINNNNMRMILLKLMKIKSI